MLQNGDITFENLTVMKDFESIGLEIVCVKVKHWFHRFLRYIRKHTFVQELC